VPPFDVDVQHDESGTARVLARGELDLAGVPQLHAALAATRADDPAAIVLDLSQVTFMDSAGIGALLRADRDFEVRIVSSPAVDRVIDLCGVRAKLSFA